MDISPALIAKLANNPELLKWLQEAAPDEMPVDSIMVSTAPATPFKTNERGQVRKIDTDAMQRNNAIHHETVKQLEAIEGLLVRPYQIACAANIRGNATQIVQALELDNVLNPSFNLLRTVTANAR